MYIIKVDGKLIKNDNLDHLSFILDYLVFRGEIKEESRDIVKAKFGGIKKFYSEVKPPFKFDLPYFVDDKGEFYKSELGVEEKLVDNFVVGAIGEGVYSFQGINMNTEQSNVGVVRYRN